MVFRLRAHCEIASPESTWLSRIGAEFVDDVVDLRQVVLEVPARGRSSRRPAAAAPGPVRRRPSTFRSSSESIFSLGSTARPLVRGVQRGSDLAGHRAVGDRLPVAQELPGVARRNQVEVLLTDRRDGVHVGRGVGRDLERVVDAHRRPGAVLGRLDVGDLADLRAAVRDVGRLVQTTRPRQVGVQLVLPDARPGWAAAGSTSPARPAR